MSKRLLKSALLFFFYNGIKKENIFLYWFKYQHMQRNTSAKWSYELCVSDDDDNDVLWMLLINKTIHQWSINFSL